MCNVIVRIAQPYFIADGKSRLVAWAAAIACRDGAYLRPLGSPRMLKAFRVSPSTAPQECLMTDSSHPTPVRNDALVRRFLADTAIHSSIHVDTPSRQALLQRGVMVIPDVLDTLLDDTGGAHAMGLLAELTGVHPTLAPAEQGRMDVLRAWWLRWGRDHGWLRTGAAA